VGSLINIIDEEAIMMGDKQGSKVAVITGAGSGMGRAISFLLAEKGVKVVLAARREKPLQELAVDLPSHQALVCPTDVSKREEVSALIKETVDNYGRIDYLFNFAGILRTGGLGGLTEESIKAMADINFLGTVYCIRAVVPIMQRQGSGHITVISSLGGKYAFPGSSGYSASKFAVAGLAKALRQELKHDGIGVTAVYPSYVGTTMLSAHLESVKSSSFYKSNSSYSPEQAVRAILKAVEKNKAELIIPPVAALTVFLYNRLPAFSEKLIGKFSGGWPRYDEPDTSS
jgi:uncharacterized protein